MDGRALIIAAAVAALPKPIFAGDVPQSQTLHYESSGRSVAVDLVRSDLTARRPAVLLLHGRGGLSPYGAAFRQLALTLASQGFIVLTPHYFDASASADAPAVTPATFETWRSKSGAIKVGAQNTSAPLSCGAGDNLQPSEHIDGGRPGDEKIGGSQGLPSAS